MPIHSARGFNHRKYTVLQLKKNADTVNRREHTNELLIPDVQGHVPECRGHCTHHSVIVYPQQLHKDGQAFLFPDSSSDIHRPLQMRGSKDIRSWGGTPTSKQHVWVFTLPSTGAKKVG